MAERKPLVILDSNIITELPVGDTLPGAFVDAPSDGQQYARQDGEWEVVTGGGLTGGIIDGGNATTTYAGEPVFDFGSAS